LQNNVKSLELLNFEITETALVTNESVLKDEITKLREHGVKVSVGDLGTVLSNLNRLCELQTNAVKIDGSFTAALN
jgi:EAL domain-containing protein (putative c-di-GMP-specific phosphodiesterase class I)